jgi:hypothetical protein
MELRITDADRKMEPVLPARRIFWRALNVSGAFCLRTKKAVLSEDGKGSQVYAPRRAAILGAPPTLTQN